MAQTLTRSDESWGITCFTVRTNAVANAPKAAHMTATSTIKGGEPAGRANTIHLIPADTVGPPE
jgi:hypothetical protein